MCLIYESDALPEEHPETFTAYKVYVSQLGVLYSPYRRGDSFGTLTRPGPKKVEKPTTVWAKGPSTEWKPNEAKHPMPLGNVFYNWKMDIAGFHVFANKEDAEAYQTHIERGIEKDRQDGFHMGFSTPRTTVAVVPVKINKADVFATGKTPFGGLTASRRNGQTYVTTQYEISDEDFGQATNSIFKDGTYVGPREETPACA